MPVLASSLEAGHIVALACALALLVLVVLRLWKAAPGGDPDARPRPAQRTLHTYRSAALWRSMREPGQDAEPPSQNSGPTGPRRFRRF